MLLDEGACAISPSPIIRRVVFHAFSEAASIESSTTRLIGNGGSSKSSQNLSELWVKEERPSFNDGLSSRDSWWGYWNTTFEYADLQEVNSRLLSVVGTSIVQTLKKWESQCRKCSIALPSQIQYMMSSVEYIFGPAIEESWITIVRTSHHVKSTTAVDVVTLERINLQVSKVHDINLWDLPMRNLRSIRTNKVTIGLTLMKLTKSLRLCGPCPKCLVRRKNYFIYTALCSNQKLITSKLRCLSSL